MIEAYVEEPLEKTTVEIDYSVLRPICPSTDLQEQEPIRLGGGPCKACDCRGFRKRKEDDGYCKCGHGYSQHEGWL